MARAINIQPIIEEIQSSLEIPSYSEHDKGFDDGLKYVLDLIEKTPTLTPQNERVTLEQLREMDGQPVYIVFLPDADGEKLQFWALVDVDAFGNVNLTNNLGGSYLYEEVMENIEAIYYRPPKGDENT